MILEHLIICSYDNQIFGIIIYLVFLSKTSQNRPKNEPTAISIQVFLLPKNWQYMLTSSRADKTIDFTTAFPYVRLIL